jgi:adenylylsulfate kinase-like enzyme
VTARRPPLLLTGGPAAGKTTTGRALAEGLPRAAFVDADDVRQLVVRGAATVWEGAEGERQMHLAARNVAAVARNLHDEGFDVVVADVLDPGTLATYRHHLPDVLVVHLVVSLAEARRRAATRRVWLTAEEFDWLHRRDTQQPPAADVRLEVDGLDAAAQVDAVWVVWLPG